MRSWNGIHTDIHCMAMVKTVANWIMNKPINLYTIFYIGKFFCDVHMCGLTEVMFLCVLGWMSLGIYPRDGFPTDEDARCGTYSTYCIVGTSVTPSISPI